MYVRGAPGQGPPTRREGRPVDTASGGQDTSRPRSSRALHGLNAMTTRPFIAIAVGVAVVGSWIAIAVTGFDQDLQFAFGTVCAGVTVTMVFVLQHTQRREQTALQLKVNELVRALPQADDHLIGVEASSDGELGELERSSRDRHTALRGDTPLYVPGGSNEPEMVDPTQRTPARLDQLTPVEPRTVRRKWFRG